ncbi:hypothetical protein ROLI_044650 [Roseobacter fucihabitans]|uniref:S-adenosyl-L-homocysteine hydrolase n=1 Tax=Roseobacter fucihabitans TaxID=1537242 RepID=A0ABZ2BZF4_9RHOB|nr:S-adenosyl-L-homocysteine hydrolase [Roseobacter litoralis]MBC6963944.1 hypothetical protein [Roseobacter litoralis]MBC6963971.1 hypothetical protein [Roseobacter litoralis]
MYQFITTAVSTIALAGPAMSGSDLVCMNKAELEAAIVGWYGEKPVLQIDDCTYLWAAGIGGTWTVVRHADDGTSCTREHGQNWSGVQGDELFAKLD